MFHLSHGLKNKVYYIHGALFRLVPQERGVLHVTHVIIIELYSLCYFLCTNWPKFGYELTGYLKLPVMYNFNKKNFPPYMYINFYIWAFTQSMLLGHVRELKIINSEILEICLWKTYYKHSKSLKYKHNEKRKQTDQHLIPTPKNFTA